MKTLLIAFAYLVSANIALAANPAHYRIPTSLPKDKAMTAKGMSETEFDDFKCANKNDEPVIITHKATDQKGIVKYTFLAPKNFSPMEKGEFKAGKPSKTSKSQKFVDEYSGEIPGFICAQPDQ